MARLHARLPLPLFHVVEHGYVDLHFPIDQEVVTYDVHVAVQWYEDPNAVRAPDPQICERLLSDDEDECAKCGEGGQLVGCEGTDCNRWFHVRCQPKSDPFPHLDGPAWYCEECLGAEWAPSQGERRLVSNLKGTHITNATCFMCERPLGADRHDKDIFKRAHFEPRCTGGSQCPAFTMDTESDMVMCTGCALEYVGKCYTCPGSCRQDVTQVVQTISGCKRPVDKSKTDRARREAGEEAAEGDAVAEARVAAIRPHAPGAPAEEERGDTLELTDFPPLSALPTTGPANEAAVVASSGMAAADSCEAPLLSVPGRRRLFKKVGVR